METIGNMGCSYASNGHGLIMFLPPQNALKGAHLMAKNEPKIGPV